LALVQLVAVVALVAATNRLERSAATTGAARRPAPPRPVRGARACLAVAAALAPSLALVAVPLAVLVERSLASGEGSGPARYGLDHYRALGERTGGLFVPPVEAVANSLLYATGAMALAVVVGGLASVVVVHAGRRSGRALDVALM